MRTVLRRERVLVLPDALDGDALKQTLADVKKAVGVRLGSLTVGEAWRVVGEFEGASDTRAIERHAGKQGTPDARPGAYKAPPSRSWRGGEEYVRPDEPKVERRRVED